MRGVWKNGGLTMSAVTAAVPKHIWDVDRVRRDFPILHQDVHGYPLAYLDNAATTQKPQVVLDALEHYFQCDNSNVHRGVHALAERATADFEAARESVRRFINARSTREVVFVRGTTEAINLVASSFGQSLRAGDEIIVSGMEHHANIVPWQLLRDRTGVLLRVIPITASGELDMDALPGLFGDRTRLVAMTHVSNALGTINPVREVIQLAHAQGVPVLLDGAQAMPHLRVDVQALDCDFYAFSGHKLFGPTGIGILYGRERLLQEMPPYQGGGEMIRTVSFEQTTYAPPPYRFEAGTPDIAGAIGLAKAIEYMENLDWDSAMQHEEQLLAYATERLQEIPGLRIIGEAAQKVALVSFVMDDVHPHDMGTILDHRGLAIRAGHHCAMPVMTFYRVPATSRASMAFYNTFAEIDRLAEALRYARELLA
jgi:cysteine desulfurase/selenocysteine lyase